MFNAFTSVLPIPRHIQLSKRDININFNKFEDFTFLNLNQQDLQNPFQSDMKNDAVLAFSTTAQLNQLECHYHARVSTMVPSK